MTGVAKMKRQAVNSHSQLVQNRKERDLVGRSELGGTVDCPTRSRANCLSNGHEVWHVDVDSEGSAS